MQLITVILIFIFVLALTYFVTRFTASVQMGRFQNANLEIIETYKIAPAKYIQVVRIGEKYFSYVVCKETVTLLGELAKDDIVGFKKDGGDKIALSFKDIFEKIKTK